MPQQFIALLPVMTLACLALGCTESNGVPRGAPESRDSSGIMIVTSTAPRVLGDESWTIAADPILQIGAIEGDSAYLFGLIWDATRLPDGRIIVTDGRSLDIREYDDNGHFESRFGGRGNGPAEFGGAPWVTSVAPDTLLVWDAGHERLSRFDLTGTLQDQILVRPTINDHSIVRLGGGLVWQVAADAAILSTGPAESRRFHEGLNDDMRRFVVLEPALERSHDFGAFPAGQNSAIRRADGLLMGIGNPYAPSTLAVLGPPSHRVSIAGTESWEIRTYSSDGTLVRILRAAIPRTPVDATLELERNRLPTIAERMGLSLAEANTAFDRFDLPDSVPPIAALHWDDSGNLWVGRRTGPIRDVQAYDIFDGNGAWLTTVHLPPAIGRIHEIGDGYILATWTDELDVPYLRMYEIQKRDE